MKQRYKDDTFLARWIADDLSPDELKQFINSEDYHQFNKINEAAQLLKTPSYNKSVTFNKVTESVLQRKKKTTIIKLIPTWIYGAVASIALVFSFFYFNNNSSSNFSTKYGEQIVVKLPDNSIVHLSPNSVLEFKKNNWNENRNLSLIGKGYFEVEKGKSFTVNTNEGKVVVLGTKFTVNSSENFFEVQCFEGKVKAISNNNNNNNETFLTKGKAFRVYNNEIENWNFSKEIPTWLNGESSFKNAPLKQVIIALEKQYNLKFNTDKIDINKRFTGTFTHENINIALKTVFAPLKISYTLAKNSSVILTYS